MSRKWHSHSLESFGYGIELAFNGCLARSRPLSHTHTFSIMTEHSSPVTSAEDDRGLILWSRHSITFQLLLAVNGICFFLLLVFVAHDYRKEFKRRLGDKRVALSEEASIVLVGAKHLQRHGEQALQRFVDRACASMEEAHSPGHHIVVKVANSSLQATSHARHSVGMLHALETAAVTPKRIGRFEQRELIVGTASQDDLTVYVSEFIDDVESQILRDSLRRLGGSIVLAVIAAVIVNYTLVRIVSRPLDRLVGLVDDIGRGTYGGETNGFRSRELSHLSQAVNRMSHTLQKNEHQRRAQLSKARRIQQNLLPESPQLAGAALAVHYAPAEDVAGDFYDIGHLTDGSWVLFMADVTGHGIPAAMTATLLKAHLAEACERSTDLLAVMRHVNQRFTALTLPGDFATAIAVRFDPARKALQVVNAGHDAALLSRMDGSLHEFRSSGLLLGVDEEADWTKEEVSPRDGDRLLLYTDGVTETFNANQNMFGRDRVIRMLRQNQTGSGADLATQIVDEITTYRGDSPQADDITMLVVDY